MCMRIPVSLSCPRAVPSGKKINKNKTNIYVHMHTYVPTNCTYAKNMCICDLF